MIKNQKILDWIKALNSGEYKQCIHMMKNSTSIKDGEEPLKHHYTYCCLGVAREVCELPVESYLDSTGSPTIFGDTLVGSERIALGLTDAETCLLAFLNDEVGLNFKQIAQILYYFYEQNLSLINNNEMPSL